jgi:hypothetical protein
MNHRLRVALVVGGLVLMAALVARVGAMTIVAMVGRVGWAFPLIVALYAAHSVLRAIVLWIGLGVHAVPFADVLRIRFSGEAVEALTYTGPLLAEPAKGVLLTGRGVPTVNAFAAISLEYLLYTVSSSAFGAAAAVLLLDRGPLPRGLHGAAIVLLVAMLAFIAGTAFAAISGIGLIAPAIRASGALIGRDRMAGVARAVADVEHVMVEFLHTRPGPVVASLMLETASHALLIAEVWAILRALALPAGLRDLLVIEGSAKLVAFVFFFVPGQLGATEGNYALIFPILGLPAAAGVTLALVRRVRSVCIAAIGIAAGSTIANRAASD